MYTISLLSRRAASLLLVMFISRIFLINEYGQYASFAAIGSYILIITNLGYHEYILYFSQGNSIDAKNMQNSFILISFLTALGLVFLSSFYITENYLIFSMIFFKAFIEGPLSSILLTNIQIENRFEKMTIINFYYSITSTLLLVVLYFNNPTFNELIFYVLLVSVSYLVLLSKDIILSFSIAKVTSFIKQINKKIYYYMMVNLTLPLYMQTPIFIASISFSNTDIGKFFAAYTFANIILLLSISQLHKYQPVLINTIKEKKDFQSLVKRYLLNMFIINITAIIFFTIFGEYVLELIFGKPEYSESYVFLIIILFGNLFQSFASVFASVFTASGMQKIKFKLQIETLLVSIISTLIFSNFFGIIGIAFSLLTIYIYSLVRYYQYYNKLKSGVFNANV